MATFRSITPTDRLFTAIIKGASKSTIQALLRKCADINARDPEGYTPLLRAAMCRQKQISQLLIKRGANVDYCGPHGSNVLHLASGNGWTEVVQSLVNIVSDLNVKDRCGMTALFRAAEMWHREVVSVLLSAGASHDFSDLSTQGMSLLDYALKNNWVEIARCLVNEAHVHDLESEEISYLHEAVSYRNLEIVKCLVEKPVDINAIHGWFDETALSLACENKYLDIVEYLLQANARCDFIDSDGNSSLYYLITMKSPRVKLIKLFVENLAVLLPSDYDIICNRFKRDILQDAEFCCRAIVNKFNNHDLPKLYQSPVAESLPEIEKMKIVRSRKNFQAIEHAVWFEIQTTGHCTQLKDRPKTLNALCVKSLLEYYDL